MGKVIVVKAVMENMPISADTNVVAAEVQAMLKREYADHVTVSVTAAVQDDTPADATKTENAPELSTAAPVGRLFTVDEQAVLANPDATADELRAVLRGQAQPVTDAKEITNAP
jgi:hypothetical protein